MPMVWLRAGLRLPGLRDRPAEHGLGMPGLRSGFSSVLPVLRETPLRRAGALSIVWGLHPRAPSPGSPSGLPPLLRNRRLGRLPQLPNALSPIGGAVPVLRPAALPPVSRPALAGGAHLPAVRGGDRRALPRLSGDPPPRRFRVSGLRGRAGLRLPALRGPRIRRDRALPPLRPGPLGALPAVRGGAAGGGRCLPGLRAGPVPGMRIGGGRGRPRLPGLRGRLHVCVRNLRRGAGAGGDGLPALWTSGIAAGRSDTARIGLMFRNRLIPEAWDPQCATPSRPGTRGPGRR